MQTARDTHLDRASRRGSLGRLLIGLTLLVPILSTAAEASHVFSPWEYEYRPANGGNRYPFLTSGGLRYQQIYDAADFLPDGNNQNPRAAELGPGWITQITFRPSLGFGGPLEIELSDVEIRLSTTTDAVDGPETRFRRQREEAQLVREGPLQLVIDFAKDSRGIPLWDFVIVLHNPFYYDPGKGNLLLDIRNNDPTDNNLFYGFSAPDVFGDTISRVYGREGQPGDTVGTTDSWALATRFTIVPEPTTVAMAIAVMTIGSARRPRSLSA